MPLAIVIETAREERVAEGERLAAELGLPILSSGELTRGAVAADLLLAVTRDALLMAPYHQGRARPGRGELAYREKGVCVELGGLDTRTGAGGLSRKQPIARAVGRDSRCVIDGTAGLGQDARLMAAMGFQVLAAVRACVRRVVVKRPPDARPVADDATTTIGSKLARYDIYVDPSRPAIR